MNPFVNSNTRSVTLPEGCKDLIDVLKSSGNDKGSEAVAFMAEDRAGLFIQIVLFQAKQNRAIELVIGAALPNGTTPIRYKVEEMWFDMPPFPSYYRPSIIYELAKMAKFPEGQFSGKGHLDVGIGSASSKWTLVMTSSKGECVLVRIND
ncbi:MAG TPA: hypothetical protein VMH87_06355 [Pseudomonadales bacterium]|nr:hypothetical protein [Pseudomonadales bacterium]